MTVMCYSPASPQGGEGCVIKKMLRSHRSLTQPGWFSFCSQSENHPGLAISGGFAAFFWSLGHPSLRWCKEGNTRDSNSFTASMTARNVSVETLWAAFCEESVVT